MAQSTRCHECVKIVKVLSSSTFVMYVRGGMTADFTVGMIREIKLSRRPVDFVFFFAALTYWLELSAPLFES